MSINSRAEWQRERLRHEMQVQHKIDNRVAEGNDIEQRADQRRLMRRIALELKDAEMDEKLIKMREAEIISAQAVEQDAHMARELQRINNETLLEKKKRLHLRESCAELKNLEARLKAAYCMKALDSQMEEKKLAEIREKNQIARINELTKGSAQMQKEEDERLEYEELMRKKQYGNELKAQMVSDTIKKEQSFQEVLTERRLLDETLQRIDEEDQKEEAERLDKLERTKQGVKDFQTAQAIWAKKQRDELEGEHNRIMEYLEKRDNNEQKRMEEQRQREEAADKLRERLSRQMFEAEQRKQERLNIIESVNEEELLAKQKRKDREDIEKKLRIEDEEKVAYSQHLADQKERKLREAAEGKARCQQLLDKMAKDDQIEEMAKEKRREKMNQFRRDVDDAMEARRIQRAEELQRTIRLDQLWEEEENKRQQMIEEERLRMLKEHAPNLVGYFPFGKL